MLSDAWRLSTGMFTALPVKPPTEVDAPRARLALLIAPLAVWPIALLAGLLAWAGQLLSLPHIVIGALIVLVVVLGSRAFHVDGLADTADGLTSSYDRERSLAVMKSGDTGPAGAAAIVLVLLLQASALGSLAWWDRGPVLIGLLVCASRFGPLVACTRGVPVAAGSSLGNSFGGSLPPLVTAMSWAVVCAAMVAVAAWVGVAWWAALMGVVLAGLLTAALTLRAVRRLGGVNGDIMGACIEISLAVLAVSLLAS